MEDALAYVVVSKNGLAGVMITDKEYPGKVAINILEELINIFTDNVPPRVWENISSKK